MSLDILTLGEALVEVMRPEVGQPLDQPGPFEGPFPSGAPFIFAVQAARLGAKVAAVGTVGDDAFGRAVWAQLAADGLDLRGLRVLPEYATGVAFIAYNHDGSREFVFHARHAASGQIAPIQLEAALFDGLKCLHLMGSTLSLSADMLDVGRLALHQAQHHGAKVSFDPNLRAQLMPLEHARAAFEPFIMAADVLMPTQEELHLLTGQPDDERAVAALTRLNPNQIIVVTQGAQGAKVYHHGRWEHVPAFSVEEVDPTGAGDCFDAGFLVRWLAGDALADAVRFANACGALAVTRRGPMSGAFHLEHVQSFIQQFTSHP
ncbi:sugar kinase [Aggregatilineales bacterium SYSU G02658]